MSTVLYTDAPESGLHEHILKLTNEDRSKAILAWGSYLNKKQTEPPGVNILESIWEKFLKDEGVDRWNGINYIYYQLCSIVSYEWSKQQIKNL